MSELDPADILYPSEPSATATASLSPASLEGFQQPAQTQDGPFTALSSALSVDDDSGLSDEATLPPNVLGDYDLKAPEGLSIAPEHVEMAVPVFREIGLSNDDANKLVPLAAKYAESIVEQWNRESETEFGNWKRDLFKQAQADPEIGGAKWKESINLAAHALDKLGAPAGSPLRKLLDDTGVGNHPEMIRVFARAGRLLGAKAPPRPRSAAETLYG